MSDLSDRDRVTAILTLADKAEAACRIGYDRTYGPGEHPGESFEEVFALRLQDIADSRWLASVALEALDTIDKAKALHETVMVSDGPWCLICDVPGPCPTTQALNGGDE